MKRTLLISMVLLMASIVMAGPITREQARQKAAQFLVSQGKPAPRNMSPAKVKSTNGTEINQYYVFNIGQRQGFVIVSGDDRTDAILGWADEGELNTDNMPDNLRSWLQGYADQLQWLADHPDAPAQHAPRRAATTTLQPIAPMTTTKWDQDSPYNDYCPLYGSERCVSGCVATATAQVMYHRAIANSIATTTTLADIPTYTKNWYDKAITGLTSTGVKTVRTFTWSEFSNTYPADATANEAVARLMEYVGAALKMDYNISDNGGSSAYNEAIPTVLKTYFGYDPDIRLLNRSQYTYEDWISIIYNELQTNGPVIMGGQSTGGGHAFVCDGYSEEDYVHINWGWGGTSDGYFKLSVLYAKQQGIGGSTSQDGFNINQTAIINIIPEDNGIADPKPTETAGETSLSASMTKITTDPHVGQPATVEVTINNTGSKIFSGSVELRIDNKRQAGKQVEITAGDSKTFEMSFTPKNAGSFALKLYRSGSNVELASIPFTVASVAEHGTIVISDVNVLSTNIGKDGNNRFRNYGKTFQAKVSLTETAGKAYNGTITVEAYEFTWPNPGRWGSGTGYCISKKDVLVNIPANGTQDIDIEYTDLNTSNVVSYRLKTYQFDGTLCPYNDGDGIQRIHFYSDPAVNIFKDDGTATAIIPDATIAVPDDALAVDVSDITGVTSITPNENPNTLYFVSGSIPSGLDGKNVVVDGTCAKLTLTDGNGFWAPKNFTATEAVYTRQFTVGADGSNGWSTIVLPFTVSQVKQGEKLIDWFHSSSDTGKNFWVKTFSSEDGSTVNFDFASTMAANTPYIIAVPGNKWGEAWNLTNKDITFYGTAVTINADAVNATNGFIYKFAGVTKMTDIGSVYQLNATGNTFETSSAPVAPFRGYFKALGSLLGSLPETLSIGSEGNQPTAISNITTTRPETDGAWYTLDGRHVDNPTKGVSIKNGKKVVIK